MIQVLGFFGCFRSTQPTVQWRGRDLEIAPTEEYKICGNDYCPVSMVSCHGVCTGGRKPSDEVFDVLGNPARNKIC